VVAFQPTGWNFSGSRGYSSSGSSGSSDGRSGQPPPDMPDPPLIRSRHKDGNTIHSVAYSEHSSFLELVQFTDIFKPHLIIPTVNTSKDKVKVQLDFLRSGLQQQLQRSSEAMHGPARATDIEEPVHHIGGVESRKEAPTRPAAGVLTRNEFI